MPEVVVYAIGGRSQEQKRGLCKDITEHPFFVVDEDGSLVPRHSVYYVVPATTADLNDLADYLNSEPARAWLRAHCQRAAEEDSGN